jgi:hypothetical protein
MAAQQTVIFTVVPRGISIDRNPMPISVMVSPRLGGATKLGAFPDWLNWTSSLKQNGLTFSIRCAGYSRDVAIDPDGLRPDLWRALFNEETLVDPFQFPDYVQRGIISYSMRQTLSALKSVYQEASVTLALPATGDLREQQGNRGTLRNLIAGLDVHWNGDSARSWRREVRAMNRDGSFAAAAFEYMNRLDAEGLLLRDPDPATLQRAAVPFAVFHHMPTPERKGEPPKLSTDKVLDFHRVLSSLNSYPELQRALGLVFDLELPANFVRETPAGKFETLSVGPANLGWQITTKVPELPTAYVHVESGAHRLFFTAPRAMTDGNAPCTIIGLLDLDPNRFGLAQVDVDGVMHKTMILAETVNNPDPARNLDPNAQLESAPHPEVFDPEATLPSLRSGGFSLFADQRGLELLDSLKRSTAFNDAVINNGAAPPPFFAEDLVRGYRLDIWDAHSNAWHSLHLRNGVYVIGEEKFTTENEEGFVQLAITQPAPGAQSSDPDATSDLYIHEAIARWAGWSLSAPHPGKHLSRFADPDKAVPPDGDDPDYAENQPVTPFKMTVNYLVAPGTLPRLRFGTRYRIRARVVDLAGNSMKPDDKLADALAAIFALPRDVEGFTYLRYEPVAAPLIVLRDPAAVTSPGSAIDRVVIRTFNDDISKDGNAADTTAADRHIVPPRTSVEMGEHLGIFDDADGKLKSDAATWELIAKRDAGEFNQVEIQIAGKPQDPAHPDRYPVEPAEKIDALPYLPDQLSRGAALRDLPGTPSSAIATIAPNGAAAAPIDYDLLSDPNPRPGSATLLRFGGGDDWQETVGFRFALEEPKPGEKDLRPTWDPAARLLTVFLPKGETAVVPLSSFVSADDLKLLGVWQWLREYIERVTITNPQQQFLRPGFAIDQIAHILQRAVEGGHWMLTPPRLITLVHAVQQPIGRPSFGALRIEHDNVVWDPAPLQSEPSAGRTDSTELAPITSWRGLGATDAFLIGALRLHAASTTKIDLFANWDEPIDDVAKKTWSNSSQSAHVDELPLPRVSEGYLAAPGANQRQVGYYDPEHDQICFVRTGDWIGTPNKNQRFLSAAAPRHLFNDTKHRRVNYTAVATSRYREYFSAETNLDFTRTSEPIAVDVPASARPLAPSVAYVLPTFGWERQTATNLKRSVRFGGGLRIYLRRPWFSSGEGELLGAALWSYANGALDPTQRDKFKPFITQWGMDPIWRTENLSGAPANYDFADPASTDFGVSLEEKSAADSATGQPGRVDVVGFPVQFDAERALWFSDLTINLPTETYMPFVRLALVRYQPHALADAKISRVVLADFAQLTPDRSAMVTSDPHHAKTIRVVVSGVAPRGPSPVFHGTPADKFGIQRPTQIRVRVQERDETLASDLAWSDVPASDAKITTGFDDLAPGQPSLTLWAGSVAFAKIPEPGRCRLLIEEFEYVSANFMLQEGRAVQPPRRLIYAETFELDDALISEA